MNRSRQFGYFTGSYDLYKLRDEPRYPELNKYILIGWFTKYLTKAIYEFKNDPMDPLTYHAPDGRCYRPKDKMETDMGSVPAILQPLVPKDRYIQSFLVHDSGYEDGGLFVSAIGQGDGFAFVILSRNGLDRLLQKGVGAEGGVAFQRNAIYDAVNLFGWTVWKHGYKREGNNNA